MKAERVIFRTEWNEYLDKDTLLAVFPDDDANLGRICYVPFYFLGDETIWYEPYGEMAVDYYYRNTKPVKDAELIGKCIQALTVRYGGKYQSMQKIIRG